MPRIICFLVLFLLTERALGQDRDPTVELFRERSEVVVAGEIVTNPVLEVRTGDLNLKPVPGLVVHTCLVKVEEIFKGEKLAPKEIEVFAPRWASSEKELPPTLKKGEKVILFLNQMFSEDPRNNRRFTTMDHWVGLQPYNQRMAKVLRDMIVVDAQQKK